MNIFNDNKLSLFPTPGQSANGFRDVKATGSSVPESIKAPVITPQSLGSGLGSIAAPVRPQLQSYESASAMAVPVITTKLSLNKQTIANLDNNNLAQAAQMIKTGVFNRCRSNMKTRADDHCCNTCKNDEDSKKHSFQVDDNCTNVKSFCQNEPCLKSYRADTNPKQIAMKPIAAQLYFFESNPEPFNIINRPG